MIRFRRSGQATMYEHWRPGDLRQRFVRGLEMAPSKRMRSRYGGAPGLAGGGERMGAPASTRAAFGHLSKMLRIGTPLGNT